MRLSDLCIQRFKRRVFGSAICKPPCPVRRACPEDCIYIFFLQLFVFGNYFFDMSAQGAAAALPQTGKDKLDCHLLSLFMNAGIPETQIDAMGDYGVTSVAMYTHLANGINDVKGMGFSEDCPGPGSRGRRPQNSSQGEVGPISLSGGLHGGVHLERD